MLETLAMQPMAHGTRSRRPRVLHRATSALLPKQKQRLQLGRQHAQQRLTRLPPQQPQRLSPPGGALVAQNTPTTHDSQNSLGKNPPNCQNTQTPPDSPDAYNNTPQSPRPPFSTATASRSIQNILNNATPMPPKRKAHASDDEHDDPSQSNDGCRPPKRLRLSVGILAKPPLPAAMSVAALLAPSTALAPSAKKSLRSAPPAAENAENEAASAEGPATVESPAIAAIAEIAATAKHNPHDTALVHRHVGRPPKTAAPLAAKKDRPANGFSQELKNLQVTPAAAVAAVAAPPTSAGGRQLRSQQATRFKSELAAYFPEYDEVIGNEPKEEHMLNLDTPILLVDSTCTPATAGTKDDEDAARVTYGPGSVPAVRDYSGTLFSDLFDSHVLDFGFLSSGSSSTNSRGSRGNNNSGSLVDDPLPDSMFEPHHKRAERLERSIRNTEKGRAQHEKDQIIRLLEGLQGPDWLRTMGVSGITESRKKSFEPAREHFIQGCRSILNKFRLWTLEEKRLKLEKDRAHALEASEAAAAAAAAATASRPRGRGKAKAKTQLRAEQRRRRGGRAAGADRVQEDTSLVDGADGEDESEGGEGPGEEEQPDSSDVDAVIERQLRAEALAQTRLAAKTGAPDKRRKKQQAAAAQAGEGQSGDEQAATRPKPKDVKSFFKKRYQREAALSRGRRKGRTTMAWGEPVPELPDADFDLPGDILEAKKKATRRKRKD